MYKLTFKLKGIFKKILILEMNYGIDNECCTNNDYNYLIFRYT